MLVTIQMTLYAFRIPIAGDTIGDGGDRDAEDVRKDGDAEGGEERLNETVIKGMRHKSEAEGEQGDETKGVKNGLK